MRLVSETASKAAEGSSRRRTCSDDDSKQTMCNSNRHSHKLNISDFRKTN